MFWQFLASTFSQQINRDGEEGGEGDKNIKGNFHCFEFDFVILAYATLEVRRLFLTPNSNNNSPDAGNSLSKPYREFLHHPSWFCFSRINLGACGAEAPTLAPEGPLAFGCAFAKKEGKEKSKKNKAG